MANALLLWILIVILLIILIVILGSIINSFLNTLNIQKNPNISIVNLKIPVGDIELAGYLLFPKYVLDENNNPKLKIPLIIINHGWGSSSKIMNPYACAISLGGPYACLLYDMRGFGKSPGKKGVNSKVFDDVIKVIDYASNINFIDTSRLGFLGISMGGNIALTRVYHDKRIKAIVSLASPFDTKENFLTYKAIPCRMIKLTGLNAKKISDDENKKISPKYQLKANDSELNKRIFLIHAKNDGIIKFDEFLKIKQLLNLPAEQFLICEKGNHLFRNQHIWILSSALRFFHEKL
jgi:dienelactone hydrolase